jgi:hypothetical protein
MGYVSSERLPTFMTAEQRKKAEGPKLEDEAPNDGDAPPSDVRRATTVIDEELRVFLALPDTRAQIRKVVLAPGRSSRRATKARRESGRTAAGSAKAAFR